MKPRYLFSVVDIIVNNLYIIKVIMKTIINNTNYGEIV